MKKEKQAASASDSVVEELIKLQKVIVEQNLLIDTLRNQCGKPMEMRVCESAKTVLKPYQLYLFTIDSNCSCCKSQIEKYSTYRKEVQDYIANYCKGDKLLEKYLAPHPAAAEDLHYRFTCRCGSRISGNRMPVICRVCGTGYEFNSKTYTRSSLSDSTREESVCLDCACYFENWGDDVKFEPEGLSYSTICSRELDVRSRGACFCYQRKPIERSKKCRKK